MKRQIFKDIETQRRFNEDGYAVIDFATREVVEEIALLFYEQHSQIPKGFYCDVSNTDDKFKRDMFLKIDDKLVKAMDATFINYKKLGCTFLCKAPGLEGKVNVHQDWTIVNESIYDSITVWIPTQNVDDTNGALRVLPGSHLFFNKHRSNFIPVSYTGNEELIWNNMLVANMQAGQAFVLNHAVIHASSPNLTKDERLVVAYGITSADAELIFYFKNADGKMVEKFEMPDDFLLNYSNIGQRPLMGKKVDEFVYPVSPISSDQLSKMIETEKSKRKHIPYFQKNWNL